jgi:hypothetical protein
VLHFAALHPREAGGGRVIRISLTTKVCRRSPRTRIGRGVVTVAQLVRALVCGVRGRGFDPRQSPQSARRRVIGAAVFEKQRNRSARRAPLAQLVEHRTFNPLVPGSSPGGRSVFIRSDAAFATPRLDVPSRPALRYRLVCTASSMVEQLTLNQLVEGSSPSRCTIHPLRPVSRPAEVFLGGRTPPALRRTRSARPGRRANGFVERSRDVTLAARPKAERWRLARRPNAGGSPEGRTLAARPKAERWRLARRPNARGSTEGRTLQIRRTRIHVGAWRNWQTRWI